MTDKNNPANEAEIIDLEAYTRSDKQVPVGKRYKVRIDGEDYVFDHAIVTREEVLQKAQKSPVECFSLYLKLKGCDFELIRPHQEENLAEGGVEHFITKPPMVYHYLVDSDPETTEAQEMTPNQILADSGHTPLAEYYLVQINPDGSQTSYEQTPEKPIRMKCPAMKFSAIFKGETPVS
ncbi:multiubiquitin domain-containing protein [Daejeonella sp. JGW-45]|uniref:multiubiquitin domain-containing protein n=1 Tax=Daejeonella sp. JGW-45 TaxID=3034148 RepID=UPI0023EE11BB|nr:multiubiquitin domain-containing protein [Daejeonella sp. JGW-45]